MDKNVNSSINKSLMILFAGSEYLFRVLFLEYNQFFSFLIHLILQSIFLSIQCRDGLL